MACDYTPVARPHIPLEFVYPPAAHDIPVVAVSHSAGPNIKQMAAAQPDLVLTSPTYGRFAEPIQQALSVPVLIYDVDTVADVLEKVVERDPEVMLVVRHGSPSEAREENFAGLFSNPAWAGLTAAQSGRTHELSEWLYLRYPDPRVVWAMQELRPLLYPEAQTGSGG